jgi:hypothetical protein
LIRGSIVLIDSHHEGGNGSPGVELTHPHNGILSLHFSLHLGTLRRVKGAIVLREVELMLCVVLDVVVGVGGVI